VTADPVAALLAWCAETQRVAQAATRVPWWPYRANPEVVWAGDQHAVYAYDDAMGDGDDQSIVDATYAAGPIASTDRIADAVHIARHDPSSVLAQVAAVRAVVREHQPDSVVTPELCAICGAADGRWPCTTLLELADGFTPTWRTT